MRSFTCDVCGQLVFFDNTVCLRCGSSLGFDWDARQLRAGADVPWCANRVTIGCNGLAPTFGSFCAACALTRVLRWWSTAAAAGEWRHRPDLPGRVPDDWASLRDGLDSQLAHVAGNAVGSRRSGLSSSGIPRHLLFGIRQRAAGPVRTRDAT